jgi:hypothetical protein
MQVNFKIRLWYLHICSLEKIYLKLFLDFWGKFLVPTIYLWRPYSGHHKQRAHLVLHGGVDLCAPDDAGIRVDTVNPPGNEVEGAKFFKVDEGKS